MTSATATFTRQLGGGSVAPGLIQADIQKLWAWLNEPRTAQFDDYGARTLEEFLKDLEARRDRVADWTIFGESGAVGYIGVERSSPILATFRGIVIAPEWRGKGLGTSAVRSVMEILKRNGVKKFLAGIFADNAPVLNFLVQLGFKQEGYLYGVARRDGRPLDMRIMGYPWRVA